MNTYLGACQNLTVADIDAAAVRQARFIYLEGYLWDPPAACATSGRITGCARSVTR